MMATPMRLADFIRAEIEPILEDWEAFAKTLFHASHMGRAGLRDHARDMLLEIADKLDPEPGKSHEGPGPEGVEGAQGEATWAEVHGGDRQTSGFSVVETVSEFRALRSSVVSHFTRAYPTSAGQQLEDLTGFHEAIDQAVAESLEQYTTIKEMDTRLFGAILVTSPDPIFVLDTGGRFVYANKATADLFAREPEAIIGKSTFDLGVSVASDFHRNLDKVCVDQSTYRGTFSHSSTSGASAKFDYLLAPVLDEQRSTEATVCICRDITEQSLAEERIWHNAHHDMLTGLPNRRLFLDRLEQEIRHANRGDLSLCVIFMDLDGFKQVNDSFGHEFGDRLLSDVAVRLSAAVRDDDTVARLGGDEFTVILTDARQREDVERVARSIIESLATPFDIAGHRVAVSVSIGACFYPSDADSPAALLEAADRAMYRAKKVGRNQICFHEAAMLPAA